MAETFTLGTGESIFSIGLLSSKGNLGHGLNLFFPKRNSYIMVDKQKYYVLNISPENITLQLSERK